MDIATTSINLKQSTLSQNVSIALTKKIMDNANESAQSLLKVMETNTNPNLGSNLDVRV